MKGTKRILSLILSGIMIVVSSFGFFTNANTYVYVEISSPSINVGETAYVGASVNGDVVPVSWSSSNPQIATVNSNGMVTGVAGGMTTIIADPPDSISTETYAVGVMVTDDTGIVEGEEYFIMSANSHRLLSLSASADAHGNTIITSSRTNSNIKKWRVNETSDGIYAFESLYSTTGKSIGVYSDMSVYLFSQPSSPFSDFEIIRTHDYIYHQNNDGLYLIKHGEYYLASNSSGNVYLTTAINPMCFWSFFRVDKGGAKIFSFDYMETDCHFLTTDNNIRFENLFGGSGYIAYSYINYDPQIAYDYLKLIDVFAYNGHGSPGAIVFKNSATNVMGSIVANHTMVINGSISPVNLCSPNELASSRCVLYLGCNTGKSFERGPFSFNLVDITYEKGSHFVLGTTEILYINDSNDWLHYFLYAIGNGQNISQAIGYAQTSLGEIECTYMKDGEEFEKTLAAYPIYFRGDTKQYLR